MFYICIAQKQVYALEKWQGMKKLTKIGTFLHKTLYSHMYLLLAQHYFFNVELTLGLIVVFTILKILPLKTESLSSRITFCKKNGPSLTKKPIKTGIANFFCRVRW